jgi:FecR protein/PEGA domain
MRAKDRSDEACRHYERLEMDEATGSVVSEHHRAFMAEHLSRCETCRSMAAASALMRHSDDAGPAGPLDMLSRRRFVNFVVAQAAADGPLAEEVESAPPSGWPRWQWMSAAAVLLVLGSGLGLWWVLRGSASHGERAASKRVRAQLVMRSGEVVVEGANVGSELAVGKTLWVRRGQAALALPDDAYVLLGERSAARVVRMSKAETTLHLEQGWLLAMVRPKHQRRRFVVTTRAGRVEVTGTVFTVQVTAGRVTVEVLRGQVKLLDTAHPQRLLRRGHWAELGGKDLTARPLTAEARRVARARMASLALVSGDGNQLARLDVRSQPSGAEVVVDGVVLGRTPLSGRLRVGHHRLRVQRVGRTPVREQLILRPGDRIHRDYELGSIAVSARPLTGSDRGAVASPAGRTGGAAASAARPEKSARPEETAPKVFPPEIIHRSKPRRTGSARIRPTAPTHGAVTAGVLLRRAQKRRAVRDWRGAAAAYRLVLEKFGASSAARAALVALGMLRLDHLGNPAGALRSFNRYLRATRRGVLAQEAAYGRIRALSRLGRRTLELAALRSFLKDYPGALQSPLVKRRLAALSAPTPKQP